MRSAARGRPVDARVRREKGRVTLHVTALRCTALRHAMPHRTAPHRTVPLAEARSRARRAVVTDSISDTRHPAPELLPIIRDALTFWRAKVESFA
ncbi:hypothetical protein [Burkholderia oklahomensis]|uniref:hypothetical protein n=1 Tax=Burkholderia oklahomensis TaxID=342113 RepID=UPI000A3EBA8B|nr:hypothetical protein [Burkholderia oklahomensis]